MTTIPNGPRAGHQFRTCRKKKICAIHKCTNIIMPKDTYVCLQILQLQDGTFAITPQEPEPYQTTGFANLCLPCAGYDPQTLQPIQPEK